MTSINIDHFCNFINQSKTPYHCVKILGTLDPTLIFSGEGTVCAAPHTQWIAPLGSGTALAVRLPTKELKSFRIIASHTDSPCLKLKPKPEKHHAHYRRWFTEVYGSPLLNSYLNHDLTIAGCVTVKTDHGFKTLPVQFPDLKITIPQLAIHLDKELNQKGLHLNPAIHLAALLGTSDLQLDHMMTRLEKNISEQIHTTYSFKQGGFELFLVSAQNAAIGGLAHEFIMAPRLDNLCMVYLSFNAFMNSEPREHEAQIFVAFNHEEIGSGTRSGAGSMQFLHFLEQIASRCHSGRGEFLDILSRSLCISADMAHALHPSYPDRFDPESFPVPNKGPVLKSHACHRYATDSEGSALFTYICQEHQIPFQNYNHRSDIGCGSTVGPILAAECGLRVLDIGNAMFSMHSARELTGTRDLDHTYALFKHFYEFPSHEFFT